MALDDQLPDKIVILPEDIASTVPRRELPPADPKPFYDPSQTSDRKPNNVVAQPYKGLWIGVMAIIIGCLTGSLLFGMAYIGQRIALPPEMIFQRLAARGLPGMACLFAAFQVPAGIGIILHRRWGRSLAGVSSLGLILTLGLWTALSFLDSGPFGQGWVLTLSLVILPWLLILTIALECPRYRERVAHSER